MSMEIKHYWAHLRIFKLKLLMYYQPNQVTQAKMNKANLEITNQKEMETKATKTTKILEHLTK